MFILGHKIYFMYCINMYLAFRLCSYKYGWKWIETSLCRIGQFAAVEEPVDWEVVLIEIYRVGGETSWLL